MFCSGKRKKKNTGRDMQKWRRTREIAFFLKSTEIIRCNMVAQNREVQT